MKLFIGTCLLIFLSPGSLLWAVLFSPAVPMCLPSDFTLYVEKPECDFCVAINTTICMGFCRTKVIVRSAVGPLLYQRSCTYDKVEYRTTMLPGCSANPLFTYPVALSCHCSTCRTENNDCEGTWLLTHSISSNAFNPSLYHFWLCEFVLEQI
uniref:Thyrotropin subunit beta n=1 Tax=Neogobius melanostomus TaxID=47308 RepID=A0A8C6SEN5_9GOBI